MKYATFPSLGCLCLVLLFFTSACSGGGESARQERLAPVVTAKATRRDVPRTLEAVGNVQAFATVAVKPQVGGQIISVPVVSGQDVEAGQVLFQLDPRPYEATVKEAEARLLRDKVLLRKAEEDLSRYQRLVRQDAISREQYDQALATAESQRATVAEDEATLASARLQLEYATVTAPLSGRIGEVLLDQGNVVKANDDRTLLVINAICPAKVHFAVPERFLSEIMAQFRQGDVVVKAVPEGFGAVAAVGKLSSIDNAVDSSTGTIRLQATFENKDYALWPGRFVRLSMALSALPDALVIDAGAVLEGIIGQYVYVVDAEDRVKARAVSARHSNDREMLVEKGLSEGERVVIDGQLGLSDGVKVVERVREDLNPDGAVSQ